MHFHTERTTTEKLGETLDRLASDALRVTPTFIGGRDWVVVAEHREHAVDDGSDGDAQCPQRHVDDPSWRCMLRAGHDTDHAFMPPGSSPVLILVQFDCPAYADRDERIDRLASRIGEVVRETTGVERVEFPIGPAYLRPLTAG